MNQSMNQEQVNIIQQVIDHSSRDRTHSQLHKPLVVPYDAILLMQDLLEASMTERPIEVHLIHQVNCQNKMGAGIAKSIASHYPVVKEQYHMLSSSLSPTQQFGYIQPVNVLPYAFVHNCFSQLTYGHQGVHTDMDTLIRNIRFVAQTNQYKNQNHPETLRITIIPYGIGCGLGGGDWSTLVQALKNEALIVAKL